MLTSVFGVVYGLLSARALSLVLVYVINRQSFNWSIDLAIPAWQLARAQHHADRSGRRHGDLERPRRDERGRGARGA